MSNDGSDASKIRIFKFPADFFLHEIKGKSIKMLETKPAPPVIQGKFNCCFYSRIVSLTVYRLWKNVTIQFTLHYVVYFKAPDIVKITEFPSKDSK